MSTAAVGLGRVPCPEWFDLEARVSKEKSGADEDSTTDVWGAYHGRSGDSSRTRVQ